MKQSSYVKSNNRRLLNKTTAGCPVYTLSTQIFFQQVKIYFRLLSNYRKLAVKRSFYFYIYSLPLFGLPFYLLAKVGLLIKSDYLIKLFLESRISKSGIRYFASRERHYIANTLKSYNTLSCELKTRHGLDIGVQAKITQLNDKGYCSLGKMFSDEECQNFIRSLRNKVCFNSQTAMQSDGIARSFSLNSSSAHYVFLPEATLSFLPFRRLLKSRELNAIIDSYLKYDSTIYALSTWYNPEIDSDHYVHRLHRDNDDYRFLTLIIYWTKVTRTNGATSLVEESHRSEVEDLGSKKIFMEGEEGSAFFADFNAFHAGNKILKGFRYTTQIRFGKDTNYASVIDGSVHSPTPEQLEYIFRC